MPAATAVPAGMALASHATPMSRMVDVSVVIPAFNEREALPRTLACLARQAGRFEIIVVDGGSIDGTAAIARRHAGVRVVNAPKGRAVQMNAGARVASGEWLLFLHADTHLPDGALLRVAGLHVAAGAFRHAFSSPDWRLRTVSWLHNQRCRYTRIFFGDHAMFVRAALFWRLGGFPEVPILEDVLLSEKLREATRPAFLDAVAVTDARKFLANGVWRTTWRGLVILARHELKLRVRPGAFFDDAG